MYAVRTSSSSRAGAIGFPLETHRRNLETVLRIAPRVVIPGARASARTAIGPGALPQLSVLTVAAAILARASQCQATNPSATASGGSTLRLSAAQPPVASMAPEPNAVIATLPNTMKSWVAWTRTRSSGAEAVVSKVVPPTNMKFQPTPSRVSAIMNVAKNGGS